MKVGDLVMLHDTGWRYGGEVGIIVNVFPISQTVKQKEEDHKPFAFKVLLAQGKLISKLRGQMEVISESR